MKNSLLFICLLALSSIAFTQNGNPDSLRTHQVRANDTDSNIPWELATHYAWYNPTANPRNLLLVYMPGTIDNPLNTTYFTSLAANEGYHVVSLKYPNGMSAQNPCRMNADSNCYENFRLEIIEGINHSPDVQIDSSESILNRLTKLLIWLNNENPGEGWDAYLTGNQLEWEKFVLAGHSQGGGHAALMARDHLVNRVIMFASPNDYSEVYSDAAFWEYEPHITPDSAYFCFGNLYDDIADYSEQFVQWEALNMPDAGDSLQIDGLNYPFSMYHRLYTTYQTSGLSGNHNNMVRDAETPLDSAGVPVFECVWKYLLGLSCPTTSGIIPSESQTVTIFPNPAEERAQISWPSEQSKQIEIQVFSTLGELVSERKIQMGSRIEIFRDGLPAGRYFVLLRNERGARAGGWIYWE